MHCGANTSSSAPTTTNSGVPVGERVGPTRVILSVDAIARNVHERWLRRTDRSYSPFNKPWLELTTEQRRLSSRDTVNVLEAAGVDYVDEYAKGQAPQPESPKDANDTQGRAETPAASTAPMEAMRIAADPQYRRDELERQRLRVADEAMRCLQRIMVVASPETLGGRGVLVMMCGGTPATGGT